MNREQAISAARWVVTTFGAFIAGMFAASGWISSDTVLAMLNSETIIGLLATVITLIWGLFSHSNSSQVTAVARIPAVNNKELEKAVGPALAKAVPKE